MRRGGVVGGEEAAAAAAAAAWGRREKGDRAMEGEEEISSRASFDSQSFERKLPLARQPEYFGEGPQIFSG
jgi:hypothetical protein